MPGAVPQTSTYALTNATLAYALQIAESGWKAAARGNEALARGVNTAHGRLTNRAVAEAFAMEHQPLELALGE
jgi:alanine dehydrogenase